MKFILTRHGTTDWNIEKRIQGHIDRSLVPEGIKEAEKLADNLRSLNIQLIMSSDLKRATETAKIFSDILKAEIKTDHRFRECSHGTLEGLTREEILEQHGPMVAKFFESDNNQYDFRPFGGESRQEVIARHMEAIKELTDTQYDKQAILLVGHGRGLNTLLSNLGYEGNLKRGEYRIIEYI